jgi:hypothetical protein
MGDITLDHLMRANKAVVLPDNSTVRVRSLSDAERRQKQLASLRASIRLDEKLADETTDEYAVYLYSVKQLSRDELLKVLEQWKRNNAMESAVRELEPEYIPFPDNPSDDEMKDVLKLREASEKQLADRRVEYVENQVKAYLQSAEKWTDDTLLKEAIARKRMLVSLEEVLNEDVYQSVYLGTCKEDGSRYFENIQQVRNTSTQLLIFLLENQREVDNVNLWEVTKSGVGREIERMVDAYAALESKSP